MNRANLVFIATVALPFVGCTSSTAPSPSLSWFGDIGIADSHAVRSIGPSSSLVEGQYVLRVNPDSLQDEGNATEALAALGARNLRALPLAGGVPAGLTDTYTFASDMERNELMSRLFALDSVLWVESVAEYRTANFSDDPYGSFQWNLSTIGIPELWATVDGSDVVVAVVDTGVSTGVDGVHELLQGYDFIDDDDEPLDPNGHGTHVAGTIAQNTNNGVGVAGVAPGATILPVRVLDEEGIGTSVGLASGIIWAVDQGADVVNMSLSSNAPSTVVEEACAYAEEAGVLVVAASGNDGNESFVSYPAAYETTLAVGATDLQDELAYYSNQGPVLDLVAPGGDLTADRNGDLFPDGILQETVFSGQWGYIMMAGTSMATPHVSGIAALLIADGLSDPLDLRTALTSTAQDLGTPGKDDAYGHGLVDPQAAIGYTPPAEPPPFEVVNPGSRPLGPGRALLMWRTHLLSTTYVEGENGWVFQDNTERRVHRALARGEQGETILFQLSSVSLEGYEATAEVEISF